MTRVMKRRFAMKRMWILLLACLCIGKAGISQSDMGKTLCGMIVTDAYVAEARLRSGDGELSGAVVFTAREGTGAREMEAIVGASASDGEWAAMADYALKGCSAMAGEALLGNLDGSIARGEDGSLTLYVRYELPEGMKAVALSPVGGMADTGDIPLR